MALPEESMNRTCRFCAASLSDVVVDLGVSPLCESFLGGDQLDAMEPFYPLNVLVCRTCYLVQLPAYVSPEAIFTEYAYFSSFSTSWLEHARRYAGEMQRALDLGPHSLVVEVGSNDGYLLRNFVAAGIPVLGIEPAQNVAQSAAAAGVRTLPRFFGRELALELRSEGYRADLLACNNTLAQIPEINDFVAGLAELLAPEGLLTIEVPHLLRLLAENQFDTIYHEHFSYFSLGTIQMILERHGLSVVDVEQLPTHGGSLRVHARHRSIATPGPRVDALLEVERREGLGDIATYAAFGHRVARLKQSILHTLIELIRDGRSIAGYGAPGKANTLLNYCGIGPEILPFTVDRNPYKQGRYTPGMRIPIHAPERLQEVRPDVVWILPWNLRSEIASQLSGVSRWGGQLFVAIPEPELFDPAARSNPVEPGISVAPQ
jgi:predicted TPR repeat methyltransferase